jgi:hypothetical protein
VRTVYRLPRPHAARAVESRDVSTLAVMSRARWMIVRLTALGLSSCEDLSMNISCPATVEVDAIGRISTEFSGDLDDLSWRGRRSSFIRSSASR